MLDVLADVAEGLQRALLHDLGAGGVGHVAHQRGDQPRPAAARQLHHRDHVDTLSRCARPEALRVKNTTLTVQYQIRLGVRVLPTHLRAERPHDVLLGVDADILGDVEPALLVLGPQRLVVGVEEVLQLDTGLLSAHRAVAAVIQHV